MTSADNEYYITYRGDGKLGFYQGDTLVWESPTGSTKPKSARINNQGSFETIDTDGVSYWSTRTKGSSPVVLSVQTNGQLVLYDGTLRVLWGKGTANGDTDSNTETLYAGVTNNNMVFSTTSSSQATFSFQTEDGTSLPERCDLSELRKQCADTCIGFIHDPKANEWQPIKHDAKTTDFKITNTVQDMYMKVPQVKVKDPSCKEGPATYIDSGTFSHYVKGADLMDNGTKQCARPSQKLEKDQKEMIRKRDKEWSTVEKDAADFDNSPLNKWTDSINGNFEKTKQRSKELKRQVQELKNAKDNETLKKQASDSSIVDRQAKLQATIWGVIALVALGILIVWRFGVVYGVIYTAGILLVCYVIYRFK